MRDRLLMKRLKLAAISLVLALCGWFELKAVQVDITGRGPSLADRVAPDDGAVLAIHFTGDMHGNLDSCG